MRKHTAEKGSLNQYNSRRGNRTLEGERGKSKRNRNRQLREAKETKTNIRMRELVKKKQNREEGRLKSYEAQKKEETKMINEG